MAFYTQKELLRQDVRRKEEQEITPGEAKLEVALDPGVRLADHLRGIWDIEFLDANGPQSLPRKGCELLLDAGPTGRGLRGLLGRAQSLRGDGPVEFMVQGDLASVDAARLRWRLFAGGRIAGAPSHECQVVLDEVWASWGNAGSGTLSGSLQSLQASPLAPVSAARFVARKRVFPAARDQSGLSPALLAWLVSPQHRLFHQLWHASRDRWHTLPKDKRNSLRGLGWQPGPVKHERDARGRRKHRNASGIDFLFMHRHMLLHARSLQPDLVSWQQLPQPCARLEQDRQAFIRYYENHDGCSVPPAWVADDDEEFTQWLHGLKGDAAFYGNFQVWESQYQDPEYLSHLTLGQFGSEVELGLHDWLHMRWADVARDPSNGMPVMEARLSSDFAGRWYQPQNDFSAIPSRPTCTPCSGNSMAGSMTGSTTGSGPTSATTPAKYCAARSMACPGSPPGVGSRSTTRGWGPRPMLRPPGQCPGRNVPGDGSGGHEAGLAHRPEPRRRGAGPAQAGTAAALVCPALEALRRGIQLLRATSARKLKSPLYRLACHCPVLWSKNLTGARQCRFSILNP